MHYLVITCLETSCSLLKDLFEWYRKRQAEKKINDEIACEFPEANILPQQAGKNFIDWKCSFINLIDTEMYLWYIYMRVWSEVVYIHAWAAT